MSKTKNVESNETNIVELVKEFKPLTGSEIKEKITVKSHLTIADKESIYNTVYNGCVSYDNENGVYQIDNIMVDASFELSVLSICTNFYDVIEDADMYSYKYLSEENLFTDICKDKEMRDLLDTIQYQIEDYVDNYNSVGSCIFRISKELINKIPEIKDINKAINSVPKAINKIDKETISIFAKELKNGTISEQVINKY